eukprot:Gb_00223 [translate_table: standard]
MMPMPGQGKTVEDIKREAVRDKEMAEEISKASNENNEHVPSTESPLLGVSSAQVPTSGISNVLLDKALFPVHFPICLLDNPIKHALGSPREKRKKPEIKTSTHKLSQIVTCLSVLHSFLLWPYGILLRGSEKKQKYNFQSLRNDDVSTISNPFSDV